MWNKFSLFVAFGCLLLPAAGHGEIEIQGRVLNPASAPLPKIEVVLSELPSPLELGPLIAAGKTHPPPTAITRTDENGRFRLAAPRPGMWTVIVRGEGFLPVEHPLQPLLEPADLGTLILRRAADRKLRIVDAGGRPVVGALARLTEELRWSRFTDTSGGWWPALSLGVSDDQGWLTLPLGRGEKLEAVAWTPGFLESLIDSRGTQTRVQLLPGQPRQIQIRGPDNKPLGEAGVRVGQGQWPVGSSDADGRLTVPIPARGTLVLEVVSTAGSASFHLGPAKVTLDPPKILTLPPSRSLSGRIVGARDSDPIAGAWIWRRQDPTGFVRSNADGDFSLLLGSQDSGRIVAAAQGFLRATEDMEADSSAPTPVIGLEPAARLDGVVVDAEGHVVPDARIEARLSANRSPARPSTPVSTATSDSRGRFRALGLALKKHYELTADAEGFAQARVEVATFESPGERVRIVLDRGRRAFGAVVDGAGEPVVGAEVALTATASPELSKTAVTDQEGTFELYQLPAGRYDLSVTAAGFAPAVVRGLELVSVAGAADLGTVYLEPGMRLEGRVITSGGIPLSGVSVYALIQAATPGLTGPGQQLLTDVEGRFTAVDLRPGERVTLQLWKEGFQNRMLNGLEAPTPEPIEITLRPASRVSGRVIDGDRQPIARARVGLVRGGSGAVLGDPAATPGHHGPATLSNANGEFTIEAVAPGRYALAAFAEGFQPARTGELEIAEGRDVGGQVLTLETGAVLEGRVLSPEGRPVTGARVAVTGNGSSPRPAITDGDGGYRIAGLTTGTTSVAASHQDHQRVARKLQIQPGVNDLDLTFEPGFEIAGWVVTDAGDPVPFARLSIAPGGSVTTTDAAGEFTFASVGEGRYQIRIDKPGHPSATLDDEVVVAGGPVYGLELLLEVSGAIVGNLRGLTFDELARVQVSALRSGHSAVRGFVDYEGGYRIDRLSPGEWTVIAELPGDPRTSRGRVAVEPFSPEALLDLDFSSGHTLAGWVLQAGKPVAGAVVLLSGDRGAAGAGKTDTSGAFLLTGIETGGYLLSISHLDRGLEHSREVDLDSDRDLIIDVTSTRRFPEPESSGSRER